MYNGRDKLELTNCYNIPLYYFQHCSFFLLFESFFFFFSSQVFTGELKNAEILVFSG